MYLVLLEFTEQVVYLLRFRHEIGRTNQRLPAEVAGLPEVWQQVLDIEDASDIVAVVLIDGNTRVVVLDNTLQHLVERRLEVEVNDILAAGHNLLGCLVTKAHNTLQHALLVLDFLLVCQLKSLLQVIDAQEVVLLLHHLTSQDA